ncbi:hypothetical protein [Actinoplanes subtropicus]|uniref:hypothetical protein n=1 Tax=Actinoplanes subtropicus TaxID=543632 RepID=UPI000A533930|nr:hypothetical protein [Actinoplanes subtropicus]
MRFREYADRPRTAAYRPPAPRSRSAPPPITDHARWMRDDVTSTILTMPPGSPRAAVFGEIVQAGFRDAFCLVVDDDGKAEYQVERGAATVEVDRDLALIARYALDRLIDNADSRLHNGLFRAAVWAATASPVRTETSGSLWVATFEVCGEEPPAVPDLAGLLPGDGGLAAALARMLASPVDLAARRAFEEATDAAAAVLGTHPPRLDLTRTMLTAAGVTAALLGDTDSSRTATIGEIAVTGLWPEDGDPLEGRPLSTPVSWHGMDWQLIG